MPDSQSKPAVAPNSSSDGLMPVVAQLEEADVASGDHVSQTVQSNPPLPAEQVVATSQQSAAVDENESVGARKKGIVAGLHSDSATSASSGSESAPSPASSEPSILLPSDVQDNPALANPFSRLRSEEEDELHALPPVTSSSSSSPPSSNDHALSPVSPSSPHVSSPLLSTATSPRTSSFISSRLNPHAPPVPRSQPPSRRASRATSRFMSEESAALSSAHRRGSMLLYRLASEVDDKEVLAVPNFNFNQGSTVSGSGSHSTSVLSFDDKYPSEKPRGMIPYIFDPDLANDGPKDEVDRLHEEEFYTGSSFSWRGLLNVVSLVTLILLILCLFIFYPTFEAVQNAARLLAQDTDKHINGTGQAAVLFQMPQLVDVDTPDNVKTRTGYDGKSYSLVYSDEFNKDGRTFYPGDDPYWEAVDLWYWPTSDLEWYDPGNAFTRDGHLVILLENIVNHGLNYRSAMLQSWNKFCFTNGYIEVSLSLPGPDENTAGYWPGIWTMGNLGRPGYGATTDGTWPYSYDSCDVGTFPNQTYANKSGPAAAVDSTASSSTYNNELSWLSGQRASACTCKGEDHPGPSNSKGRGAPEIDVLEAQKNQVTGVGGKVSQSVQFAPFTHDYDFTTSSTDIINSDITQFNGYKGSAVQQAISALTDLPSDIFNGSGGNFYTFGFEYWSDSSSPEDGYIVWQSAGVESFKVDPGAVGPDPLPSGTGVSQRRVSEEPMSIILNLGMSKGFQEIDLDTMTFPAEMHIDYVRVYQRDGEENIGCSPKNYPTADYIEKHLNAYSNPNLTTWEQAGYTRPKNSQYDGC